MHCIENNRQPTVWQKLHVLHTIPGPLPPETIFSTETQLVPGAHATAWPRHGPVMLSPQA